MEIYRNFTKQTEFVVGYLSIARQYEHQTRVEVPKLKHAPVNLGRQLEDYLKDPDFEANRRQYLAEQASKVKFKVSSGKNNRSASKTRAAAGRSFPDAKPSPDVPKATPQPAAPATKPPASDLIDFFGSIEPQQAMQQGQYPAGNFQHQNIQQTGYMPAQNGVQQAQSAMLDQNGFSIQQVQQPVQQNFTGAGFGGYSPQAYQTGNTMTLNQDPSAMFNSTSPVPQQQLLPVQPQNTNPFRQSVFASSQPNGIVSPQLSPPVRQSTNPFAQSMNPPVTSPYLQSPSLDQSTANFQSLQIQSPHQSPPPLVPSATGTNPFAKRPQTAGNIGLAPQATGNTNPFRQSQFVNHATGMGWQSNQGVMGGGLDQVETMPVFPRPGQQSAWNQ